MPEWDWRLKDLENIKSNGRNVFSTFSCGGGSSFGYKLAGFNVIGCVEIDKEMMKIYKENHNPDFPFLMPIQKFNKIPNEDLPESLFNLDILDGSPPCSTFSLAGKRDKVWGKKKKFREGQAVQRLDNLFFDFLDTVEKLSPKIVVAENVKGIIQGKAKGFVKLIKDRFNELGYKLQIFLLNAASMGVPQKRERVFFIASKKELHYSKLELAFNEKPIYYKDIRSGKGKPLKKNTKTYKLWEKRKAGDKSFESIMQRERGKSSFFNHVIVKDNDVCNTLTGNANIYRFDEPAHISKTDCIRISTFPKDYNFIDQDVNYVCGMSVPPIMMKKIAEQIYLQWFSEERD